jgi:hypothetical protein
MRISAGADQLSGVMLWWLRLEEEWTVRREFVVV